jgi:hypothetical protein
MATPLVRRLDNNHDISFGNGLADYIGGAASTAQRVRCYFLGIAGEWFLDTGRFLPWFQPEGSAVRPIMGGRRDLAYAEATIKAGFLSIVGVASIEAFSLSFDGRTRKLTVSATLTTDDGDVVNIVQVGP